jgi:sulfur carrier protein
MAPLARAGCLKNLPAHVLPAMKIILPDEECRYLDSEPLTVEGLLEGLGINPLEVIVSRNGRLVSELALVGPDDEVRIRRIAHGG